MPEQYSSNTNVLPCHEEPAKGTSSHGHNGRKKGVRRLFIRLFIRVVLFFFSLGANPDSDRARGGQVIEQDEEEAPAHGVDLLHKNDVVVAQKIGLHRIPDMEHVYFFARLPSPV